MKCDNATCTSDNATCTCQTKLLYLPARGPEERLGEVGVQRSSESPTLVRVPNDWDIVPSSVSPYHRHLVDGNGKAVCCILDKSLGGGSFQITCTGNCADAQK